jgi:hypothetical protein
VNSAAETDQPRTSLQTAERSSEEEVGCKLSVERESESGDTSRMDATDRSIMETDHRINASESSDGRPINI